MVGGIMVSVDTLRGMEDVEFDFGVSAQVKGDFIVAASQMRSVLGAMPGLRSAALVQFEGYYSTIFADNGATQTRTATRSISSFWSRLVRTARWHRRGLSAALFGCAVLLALASLSPAPPASTRVVVAAHDPHTRRGPRRLPRLIPQHRHQDRRRRRAARRLSERAPRTEACLCRLLRPPAPAAVPPPDGPAGRDRRRAHRCRVDR